MNHNQLLQPLACLGLGILLLAGCGTAQGAQGKRALLIIQEHFNAAEYGEPRALLEEQGVAVAVASASLEMVTAYAGETQVQPDVLLSEVHSADYDVFVFAGGYPYSTDDPEAQRVAREAVAEGKLVAAICNAVITLAKAGVLEGKQVTSLTYHGASALKAAGAIPTDTAVGRDGLIITGNGPGASRQFAEAIAAALQE